LRNSRRKFVRFKKPTWSWEEKSKGGRKAPLVGGKKKKKKEKEKNRKERTKMPWKTSLFNTRRPFFGLGCFWGGGGGGVQGLGCHRISMVQARPGTFRGTGSRVLRGCVGGGTCPDSPENPLCLPRKGGVGGFVQQIGEKKYGRVLLKCKGLTVQCVRSGGGGVVWGLHHPLVSIVTEVA